ncbi:flavin reductase family protein [Streptomyces sp. NPDC005953]|uniref:flavin reductase family protein n=1 Tax=unclassified Streptomyces TaxID=2593676 RepID=UPI0033E8A6D8
MSPVRTAPGPVDAESLRACMRLFPTGVALLTAGRGDQAMGMSVNSVISVSLDPPLVLVSVHHSARINRRLHDEPAFALSFLAAEQTDLTTAFAAADRPVGDAAVRRLGAVLRPGGIPIAAESLGAVECELRGLLKVEDHNLLIGRVVALGRNPLHPLPQVCYGGSYTTVRTPSGHARRGARP